MPHFIVKPRKFSDPNYVCRWSRTVKEGQGKVEEDRITRLASKHTLRRHSNHSNASLPRQTGPHYCMANTDLPKVPQVDRPTRSWRAPWYCLLGRCSALDWLSGCTAFWLPCVAFGVSSSKTLRLSFWREFLKAFLVLGIVTILNLTLRNVIDVECPRKPHTAGEPVVMSSRCVGLNATLSLVLIISIICAVIWAVFYGGPRRTQLRWKMGIPADKDGLDDSCLHFCCLSCVLAQEMRTVLHMEAEGQLHAGPAGYSPLLTTVPDEQGISRANRPSVTTVVLTTRGGADNIV